MTSGLGGIAYGDEAVAAKLSLDIPAGSEALLKEISRMSGDLSANMQSVARFTGDYMGYLQSFPTIQRQVIDLQREQLQVLQATATAMNAIQTAQSGSGFVNAGYGTGREVQGGAYNPQRLPPGYPPVVVGYSQNNNNGHSNGNNGNGGNNNSNYQDELTRQGAVRDRARERDHQDRQDEEYRRRNGGTNGGTGGRHRRPAEEERESPVLDDNGRRLSRQIREQGQGAAGGINDIGSLFTPGGSNGARLASLARLMGTAPDAEGHGGSGLSGLLGRLPGSTPGAGLIGGLPTWAKGLGLAGAGVAAGTMAFNAVQNVGEGVQGLRNQDLKGHSLMGGLGVEKDVRLMAMNPLLTNDQSREIIMGALKAGHSGESYDSAVGFIKKNMIDMNMDVSKSVDLLKSNIDLGKQSISSLTFDLLNTQALAGIGNKTTDQVSEEFKHINDAMMGQGVDATTASGVAYNAAALMNGDYKGSINALGQAGPDGGDSPIAKMLAGIVGAGDNSPYKSLMRQRFAPNSDPSLTYQTTGADTTDDLMTIIKEQCRGMSLQQWISYAHAQGLSAALGDTGGTFKFTQLLWEQMNDNGFDAVAQAKSQTQELSTIKIGGKDAASLPSFDEWKAQPGNADKSKSEYNSFLDPNTREGDKPKVDSQMLKNMAISHPRAVIVDPSGKKHLLDASDPDQATGIANGTWKIYDDVLDKDTKHNDDGSLSRGPTSYQGGSTDSANTLLSKKLEGLDLSGRTPFTADAGGIVPPSGLRGGNGASAPGAGGSVDMGGNPTSGSPGGQIGLTPEARKLLTLSPFPGNVATDPNTVDSNSGANGATRNSGPR